jgi:HEAT repeat protein
MATKGAARADARRFEEVERLARAGAAGVPALVAKLGERSWALRRAVVAALAAAGDAAVEPLCRTLEAARGGETVIAAAMDALAASTGDATPAIEALTRAADVGVAADAVQVLGRRPSPPVAALARLALHPDDNVAVAAIRRPRAPRATTPPRGAWPRPRRARPRAGSAARRRGP